MEDTDQLITVREAAPLLKMSELLVQVLCRRGAVPAAKFGGQWRVNKSAIIRMVGETKTPKKQRKTSEIRPAGVSG